MQKPSVPAAREEGDKIDIERYIKERLHPQLRWYERRANLNKRVFMHSQRVILILSMLIPLIAVAEPIFAALGRSVLAGLLAEKAGDVNGATLLTAALSSLIAILAGLDKLRQPQANWFMYRANEEMLKKEEWMYCCRVGPYANLSDKRAARVLVERVEGVISADIARFTQMESALEERAETGQRELSSVPIPAQKPNTVLPVAPSVPARAQAKPSLQ